MIKASSSLFAVVSSWRNVVSVIPWFRVDRALRQIIYGFRGRHDIHWNEIMSNEKVARNLLNALMETNCEQLFNAANQSVFKERPIWVKH